MALIRPNSEGIDPVSSLCDISSVSSLTPGMVHTGLWRHFPRWYQALTYPIRAVALRSADDAVAALDRLRAAGSDPAAIKRRRSGRTGGFGSVPQQDFDHSSEPDGFPPPEIADSDSSLDHDLP